MIARTTRRLILDYYVQIVILKHQLGKEKAAVGKLVKSPDLESGGLSVRIRPAVPNWKVNSAGLRLASKAMGAAGIPLDVQIVCFPPIMEGAGVGSPSILERCSDP